MTKNWKKYQEVIKTLYISEGKTLEDVRTVMQEKHNFKASTRSYRQQFDKWGVVKYNCKKRNGRRQQQQQQHHHHHQQQQPRRSPSDLSGPVDYSSPESTSTGTDADHQQEAYSPGMVAVSHGYSNREYTYAPVQAPLQPAQTSHQWEQQHDRWRNMAPLGPAGLPSPPADMDAFFMPPAPAASEMELAAPQPVHPQSTYHVLSHHGGGQQHHHHQQQQQQMMMAQHQSSGRRYDPYQYPIRCYPRSGGSSEGYENQRPPGPGQ